MLSHRQRQVISGLIDGVGLQEVFEDKNTVFSFTTADIRRFVQ
jgi:hypothetical protein